MANLWKALVIKTQHGPTPRKASQHRTNSRRVIRIDLNKNKIKRFSLLKTTAAARCFPKCGFAAAFAGEPPPHSQGMRAKETTRSPASHVGRTGFQVGGCHRLPGEEKP